MVVLYPAYISLTFGKTGFSDPSYELKQKFVFSILLPSCFRHRMTLYALKDFRLYIAERLLL